MQNKMTIALLASIPGYRMQTKPCVSIMPITDDYKLIDLQYHCIRNVFKSTDIALTVGYNPHQVIQYRPKDIRIIENPLYNQYGEVYELRLVMNNINADSVLFINGNTLFNTEFMQSLDLSESTIFIDKVSYYDEPGCVVDKNGYVEHVGYNDLNSICGIFYFTGKEFELCEQYVNMKGKFVESQIELLNFIAKKGKLKTRFITEEYISKYKVRMKNDSNRKQSNTSTELLQTSNRSRAEQ